MAVTRTPSMSAAGMYKAMSEILAAPRTPIRSSAIATPLSMIRFR